MLTEMYCQPLRTRTRRLSSSYKKAMVPTGLMSEIYRRKENINKKSGHHKNGFSAHKNRSSPAVNDSKVLRRNDLFE